MFNMQRFMIPIICAGGLIVALAPPAQSARHRTLLDASWRFRCDPLSNLGGAVAIKQWRWTPYSGSVADAPTWYDANKNATSWKNAALAEDTFHERLGFSLYSTTLPDIPHQKRAIRFIAIDDNADVFLNGVHLAHHEGYNTAFTVELDSAWKAGGSNTLLVLVENTQGPGGIMGGVTVGTDPVVTSERPSSPDFNDAGWRLVNTPHDYVIEQPFTQGLDPGHGSLPTPAAWYRKTVVVPKTDSGKELWLDFDGVYCDSEIYVNGKLLAKQPSGYYPTHVELTKQAEPGQKLVIAVKVNPEHAEGWWYEGGGIYRHVWLTSVDPVHIKPYGVWVVPTAVGDEKNPDSANVKAPATIDNDSNSSKNVTVIERIFDPRGNIVATKKSSPVSIGNTAGDKDLETDLTFQRPQLWSLEAPNLYKLETSVEVDGKVVDQVVTTFGVRTMRWDADHGFFLNGKSIKLKGVCNHQDFAGIGIAVPDNIEAWRVKKLQEMGANAWRMSHNPPNSELLDACDKLGMLVLDENRHLGDALSPKTPSGTTADKLTELETMLLRDRNHPSIFAWSLCNEESLQSSEEGGAILQKMVDRVRKFDPTRLTTTAMNGGWGWGFSLVEDIQGCNYLDDSFERFHKKFPNKPMFFTESSSAVSDRGIYANDREKGYVESYDTQVGGGWAQTAQVAWKPVAENDFLAGCFVWTGFDYKGEPSPYGWPNINSHFGILDMCGFPKDVFYYYKANWGNKPVVHILPHWNWTGSEGKPIRVWVYTNASKVELFLNGASLGSHDVPLYGHAEWSVPYAPGTLVAKGYDRLGNLISQDTVETTDKPASLVLRTDLGSLHANGEDESVIEASIVDSKGRFVADASNDVTFTINGAAGEIIGSGNGDPSDHTPDASHERAAFSGRLAAIIRSTGKRGAVSVTAKSPGLNPVTIVVKFEK